MAQKKSANPRRPGAKRPANRTPVPAATRPRRDIPAREEIPGGEKPPPREEWA